MRILKKCVILLLLFGVFASAIAETVCVDFPATGGKQTYSVRLKFDDSAFMKDSDVYDHELACLSLGMAVAAFRSETTTYVDSDANIHEFLAQSGFTDYEAEQFSVIPTQHTIASAMARKKLPDGSVLIAVAVSGAGYRNEWMSNFAVGGDDTHEGFRAAASIVYDRLETYIRIHVPEDHVRVWIAGFSRAAATANLLASRILQGDLVEDNDVFAYTFGTPSTTKTPIAYPQIFNICNSFDPVPFMPFSNWGYGKNGVTLYLPAEEIDPGYEEKYSDAMEAFERITGSRTGFAGNANANWFLGKIMELLYRLMPESTFYSEDFQQILIDAWVTDGTMIDKMLWLIQQAMDAPSIKGQLEGRKDDASVLLAESIYNVYLEIAGKRSGRWADLFMNASRLIHEHEPAVYLAWITSTDDPAVLFDHPIAYTRLILAGEFGIEVFDSAGEPIRDRTFSAFKLNDQRYYAIPDGEYKVILTPQKDLEGIIALRYHDIRSVSETLYQTESMHYFEGEQITVMVMPGGTYSVQLGDDNISVLNEAENGLSSITGELTLQESRGINGVKGLASSLIGVVLPHILSIMLIVIYCVLMLLFKLVTRTQDEYVETHALGRWMLVIVAAASTISAGRHFYFFWAEVFNSAPNLENRIAVRIAEILGTGTQIYQMTDTVMYLLLALLAWRGRRRHRSRIRGRRLAALFIILKLIDVFSSSKLGTPTYYQIGCVLFFFGCFIAFVIVRDGAYEREMHRHFRQLHRQKREERKRRRIAARN